MRERIIAISLVLFGIEHAILQSVSDEEKNKFLKLSFLFLIIAFACLFSSVFLFFLISSSFWWALLIGPLLGLIILSIIRFSILTIQRSLWEEETVEIAAPITQIAKIKSRLNKFQFPGVAALMRLIINGMMGCLIVFPLVSLLHFQSLESLNQQKRDLLLNEFLVSKKNAFSIENNRFNNKINQLEQNLTSITHLESQGGVYSTKQKELLKLKVEQLQYKEKFALDLETQTLLLKENLASKYFIIYTLTKVVSYPEFIYVALIIFGLLFYLHFLQHSLKTNESYQYAKLAKEYYVAIVNKEYNQTKINTEKLLKLKFPDYDIDIESLSRWKNPPFNTEEKVVFPKRNAILKKELIQSLTTK